MHEWQAVAMTTDTDTKSHSNMNIHQYHSTASKVWENYKLLYTSQMSWIEFYSLLRIFILRLPGTSYITFVLKSDYHYSKSCWWKGNLDFTVNYILNLNIPSYCDCDQLMINLNITGDTFRSVDVIKHHLQFQTSFHTLKKVIIIKINTF